MNRKQAQALHYAIATLEVMGHPKVSKAIERVIDHEIRTSAEYEAAFNHADGESNSRQAFAYWYASSGRRDLAQCYLEWIERMGSNKVGT